MKTPFILLAILLLLLAGCITDPVTGSKRFGIDMSEDAEIAMGAQYAPSFRSQYEGPYPDKEIDAYCEKIVLGMAKASHRPELPWNFTILNSSEANAFALPGGTVCMTRGLLTQIENEAQFAGVMGHEIGHVSHRHSVQQQSDQTLYSILVATAAIGVEVADVKYGGELVGAGALGGQILLLSFSRGQESESDERGVEYSYQAGYDPRELAGVFRIFKRMKEESGGDSPPEWLSTHPLDDDRIRNVYDLVKKEYPQVDKTNGKGLVVTTPEWERLMARLREQQRVYDDYDRAARSMSEAIRQGDRAAMKSVLSKFESCERRLPDHALLVSSVGVVNYYLKNWSTAKRQFERAVRLQSDLFEPRYFLADIAFREGNAKTAVTHGSVAQKLWPHHPGPYYVLGRAYDTRGDVANAISNYEGVMSFSDAKTEEYKFAARRLTELKAR